MFNAESSREYYKSKIIKSFGNNAALDICKYSNKKYGFSNDVYENLLKKKPFARTYYVPGVFGYSIVAEHNFISFKKPKEK